MKLTMLVGLALMVAGCFNHPTTVEGLYHSIKNCRSTGYKIALVEITEKVYADGRVYPVYNVVCLQKVPPTEKEK